LAPLSKAEMVTLELDAQFFLFPHPRPLSTHFSGEKLVERGAVARDFR
jgi:hypothetical protein